MSKVKTSNFDVKTSKYKILYQRRTQNKDAARDVRKNQKTPYPPVRRPGGPVQSKTENQRKSNFDVKSLFSDEKIPNQNITKSTLIIKIRQLDFSNFKINSTIFLIRQNLVTF